MQKRQNHHFTNEQWWVIFETAVKGQAHQSMIQILAHLSERRVSHLCGLTVQDEMGA